MAQIAVIILAKSSKDGLSNHDGLLELGRNVEREIQHLKVSTKGRVFENYSKSLILYKTSCETLALRTFPPFDFE